MCVCVCGVFFRFLLLRSLSWPAAAKKVSLASKMCGGRRELQHTCTQTHTTQQQQSISVCVPFAEMKFGGGMCRKSTCVCLYICRIVVCLLAERGAGAAKKKRREAGLSITYRSSQSCLPLRYMAERDPQSEGVIYEGHIKAKR